MYCRSGMQTNISFGPFVFDSQRRILLRDGTKVVVGHKCLLLLEKLLAAEGRAVSKSELIIAAWQSENVEESNLAVQIAALRKCLGKTRTGEEWIATVQRVGYQFANLGEVSDKSISIPVSLVSEVLEEKPTLAVLPFQNLSRDPDQDYFSDGVTEAIITELARWRLLAVRSRAASFQYRNGATDLTQIVRNLNVRYIVQGSIWRMEDRIRIAVQLVDAVTGNHVWAEKFDRQMADYFAVQDQVVRTIVGTLAGRVQAASVERINRRPTSSLAAYECVLKGNSLAWDEPDGAVDATRLFARAISLDPNYGFAHAMLANMRLRKWRSDPESSDALLLEARELANRAVELDSNDGANFAVLATVCLLLKQFDLAEQYIARAVGMNPNNQWTAADMGVVKLYVGKPDEALKSFNRAKEIDPFFDVPWYWSCLGQAYMALDRYNDAVAAFVNIRVPEYRLAAHEAACHARLNEMDGVTSSVSECLRLKPDFSTRKLIGKMPFKNPADVRRLTESLLMAGLPD